jgi:hypothetical protein
VTTPAEIKNEMTNQTNRSDAAQDDEREENMLNRTAGTACRVDGGGECES